MVEQVRSAGGVVRRPELFGALALGGLSFELAVEQDRADDQVEHRLDAEGDSGTVDAGRF